MGKRVGGVTSGQQDTAAVRSIRKRKRAAPNVVATKTKCPRVHASENDDEDSSSSSSSSSNDAMDVHTHATIIQKTELVVRKHNIATAGGGVGACATPHNNSSMFLNSTLNSSFGGLTEHNNSIVGATTESPKPVYTLRPSVVNGTILHDLKSKSWRLGRPIGKGNFGEIFLASDNVTMPVTNDNAKFVVKIEPHSNGPLFVEIHCLMNTAKKNNNNNINEANLDDAETENNLKSEPDSNQLSDTPPTGIPDYIATGSHYFNNERYRFLVLPRFDQDLHSLIKNTCVQQKCLLTLAVNIVNALESLHDRGYCHNDIKAQNLMLSKCKYLKKQASAADFLVKKTPQGAGGGKYSQNVQKFDDEHYEEKQQTTDSGNSSEQEANDEDFYPPNETYKRIKHQLSDDDEEDEDFDDGATTNSNHSNSMDMFQTPVNKKRVQRRRNNVIEFSGSNPVRSCRREKRHSMYEEMVKSHYLRPTKRVSYSELFNEDGIPVKEESNSGQSGSSDNESEEFIPPRSLGFSQSKKLSSSKSSAAKQSLRNKETQSKERTTRNLRVTRNKGVVNSNTAVATNAGHTPHVLLPVEEERIFLIDFGLASKFEDRGVHRPFIMDQRRAHDGTLEFTSRDAHLGAHSRRSDLECLGYNLLYWSQGYLPWKDAAQQQLQEKVHRSKELLMTNVREMLKQIYGKQVPKFLGEFLYHVGQLNYQERPDYERYRNIFKREYQQLGYDCAEMQLNRKEIKSTCIRVKDEVDGNAAGIGIVSDIFELNNCVIRNSMLSTPLNEHTLTPRISPKNLRSKTDKKTNKKKKFSWAEVLSQDPDQIARERAAKEFEREEDIYPEELQKSRQYEGKPTYAILQIQQMLRSKGRSVPEHNSDTDEEMNEKGQEEGGIEEQEDDTDDDSDSNYDEELEIASSNEDEYDSEIEEEEQKQNEEEIEKGAHKSYATVYSKRSKPSNGKKVGRPSKKVTAAKRDGTPIERSVRQRRKDTTKVKFNTTTRSSAQKRNGKREVATAASAAGEVEQQHKPENSKQSRTRRARRCLQPETENTVNDEESSSSNYGPDMQGLCQIWTKFDNESVYLRGRNAAAVTANAASTATLSTVSKHSRK